MFAGLVLVHEYGHYIMARRNGVDVEEFALCFPPRLFSRTTRTGMKLSVNLIPLGGYVKLKGEHDSDTEPHSFGAASLTAKTKIMSAGIVMNLLTAIVLLTILALVGMPQLIPNQYTVKSDTSLAGKQVIITSVEAGSPAAKAGLRPQDAIIAIEIPGNSPVTITDSSQLPQVTKSFAGKNVEVFYIRGGHHYQADVTLRSASVVNASLNTGNPKGYLGVINPLNLEVQKSTWSAPIVAIGICIQYTALTFHALWQVITGVGSIFAGLLTHNTVARQNGQAQASQLTGPVGIYFILKASTALGLAYVVFIIAIISLALAIMNFLPIPALDGGRLWITLVTRAMNRPLSAKREEMINATGFIVLICLVILITFSDVKRFF